MTSWQDFARSRASKDTFLKRITTLDDFSNACTNSSFLAIRIKHIKKTSDSDRVLAQVGLAYLPSLEPDDFLDCSSANMPSLIQFYNNKRVKALTLDVHIPQEEKDQILALRDIPVRRNVRFGRQVIIHPDNLGAAVTGFLQGCFHDKNRNLVCVSFNSKAWTYMRDCFPGAMSHFSAYMDLHDIARDAAPYSGHIPGLKNCLELFRFNGELAGTEKVGVKTDNAGEHAVAVCAFANILLSSENQEKFKHRIECATMARHWESKKVRLTLTAEARFLVSVCTEARAALPYSLKSSWRIAQEFHPWNPKFAVRTSHYEALVQFHNKPDMQRFIKDMNGEVYPTSETLSVMTYEQREKERQQEPGQQDCDNQEEDHQQEWGQQECDQQEETHHNACGKQKENQQQALLDEFIRKYWECQKQACGFQKDIHQLQEDHVPKGLKDWTYPSPKKMTLDEEEDEETEDEEEEEEKEDEDDEEEEELHASGWFGEDEMPELVEDDTAADWDLLSN